MTKGLALIAVLLCGCDLYFGGGGGDDDVCNGGGTKAEPAYQLRKPAYSFLNVTPTTTL